MEIGMGLIVFDTFHPEHSVKNNRKNRGSGWPKGLSLRKQVMRIIFL